ncbi:MAG: OadG family transporter subunit [Coraliomargarita sp.]
MIHSLTILGAAEAGTTDSVSSIVVIGFSFVLLVLAVLAAVTAVMGMVFAKRAAREAEKAAEKAQHTLDKANAAGAAAKPASAPAVTSKPVAAVPADNADDEAIFAVISAAVHTVIGDRAHRIVSIRGAGPGWAQEGRRQIFSSHRVR